MVPTVFFISAPLVGLRLDRIVSHFDLSEAVGGPRWRLFIFRVQDEAEDFRRGKTFAESWHAAEGDPHFQRHPQPSPQQFFQHLDGALFSIDFLPVRTFRYGFKFAETYGSPSSSTSPIPRPRLFGTGTCCWHYIFQSLLQIPDRLSYHD